MRKIIYWVHVSVDGYINGPKGEFDWPELGPELEAYSWALNDRADTLLYGREVWTLMSSYWPTADEISDDAHAKRYAPVWREMPKAVLSRTLESAEWGARVIGRNNLADEITALKQQPGKDILLTGGAGAAGALTEFGLIDEYHIAVHPVVLGGGTPAFAPGTDRRTFRLVDAQTCDARTVVHHYELTS